MQYSLAFMAMIGSAVSITSYTYQGSVPASGFTSTVISEAGATETVPVPEVSYAASSAAPITSAPPAPTSYVVACTEYVDGQPQCASTAVVCNEYVDGQPQCVSSVVPAAPVCSEYVDGQPQCVSSVPAAPVCSEYVDGQPQCVSSVAPPVCSEYVDGQPQCGTASAIPSYYAPSGTGAYPTASYTGPAIASGPAALATPMAGLLAGALGVVALL